MVIGGNNNSENSNNNNDDDCGNAIIQLPLWGCYACNKMIRRGTSAVIT